MINRYSFFFNRRCYMVRKILKIRDLSLKILSFATYNKIMYSIKSKSSSDLPFPLGDLGLEEFKDILENPNLSM
jgi:hypothetical protein